MYINKIVKKIIIRIKNVESIKTDKDECVIFGSGPSLDKLDCTAPFLEGKDLIGCNFVHKHKSLLNMRFKMYSMIDMDYTKRVDKAYFKGLQCDNFLVATKNAYLLELSDLVQKKLMVINTRKFTSNAFIDKQPIISGTELITGNSLPFLIQCAAFLGNYKTIYLFGADHFSFDELYEDYNCNYNHYHGRKIKSLPMTHKKLERINSLYTFVNDLCEQEGVRVLNVTPNSKLDVFDKLDVPELLI